MVKASFENLPVNLIKEKGFHFYLSSGVLCKDIFLRKMLLTFIGYLKKSLSKPS